MTEVASSVGSPDCGQIDSSVASLPPHLSREEDDVLRRLYYMSRHGALSPQMREKMLELRLRDRRAEIRPPREFERTAQNGPAPKRGWGRKLFRRR